jgi:subtilisin family serine protease
MTAAHRWFLRRAAALPFALAAQILCCTVMAAQQPYVDPGLRTLLRTDARAAVEAGRLGRDVPLREQPFGGQYDLQRGLDGQVYVGLLLKVLHQAALDEVRAAGGRVGTTVGDIVTVRVPLARADRLTASARIRTIELSRRVRAHNDAGMTSVRSELVRWRAEGTWRGLAGQGVIVGIYDSGLDYLHGDFLDDDAVPRTLAIWDQECWWCSDSPPAFGYGQLCNRAMIMTRTCTLDDLHGHGTHVAGTAAGSGAASSQTPFRYAGVAPAAGLLVVAGDLTFAGIVDGVAWIFAQADTLGKPAVVNLSLGTEHGPHDGTLLFEQALDRLSGPDPGRINPDLARIIVASAGNAGDNRNTTPQQPQSLPRTHAMGTPEVASTNSVTFGVPSTECGSYAVEFSIWYDGADLLDVGVRNPLGHATRFATGETGGGTGAGSHYWIDNASGGANPENGDHEAVISGVFCGGGWAIEVTGAATPSGKPFHVWAQFPLGSWFEFSAGAGFDNSHVVAAPATARRIIAVGAHTTRTCWPSMDGSSCLEYREELGDLAVFSSGGPSRDGRLKPELTAPGNVVVSAHGRNAGNWSTDRLTPDGAHQALRGTSMAAPHVTGAVALLLQHDATLSPEDALTYLAAGARQDAFTVRTYPRGALASPSSWWGHGKLDVRAALDAAGARIGTVAALGVTPTDSTLVMGETLQLTASPSDWEGARVPDLALTWSSETPEIATVDASGMVRAVGAGSARIIAAGEAQRDTVLLTVELPSRVIVSGGPAASAGTSSSRRGVRLPLLDLGVHVDGIEALDLLRLGFDVDGSDPDARLVLLADTSGPGNTATFGTEVAGMPVSLRPGQTARVVLSLPELRLDPGDGLALRLVLEHGGGAPNATRVEARMVPQETRTRGVRSGAFRIALHDVAVMQLHTSLLEPGEALVLSENPIRSDRVNFSFAEAPRVAGVYTLSGRRVADLRARMSAEGRVEWDLTNDRGARVAAGVYLLVFEFGGRAVTQKLIIQRPGAQ